MIDGGLRQIKTNRWNTDPEKNSWSHCRTLTKQWVSTTWTSNTSCLCLGPQGSLKNKEKGKIWLQRQKHVINATFPIKLLLHIIINVKRLHLWDCLACSVNVEIRLSVFNVPEDIWRLSLSQQKEEYCNFSAYNSWISPIHVNLCQLYSFRCTGAISSGFSCGV